MDDFLGRSSWGVILATHAHAADLVWLVVVLFLLGALYLLFAAHNYVGAGVAVVLAIIVWMFLM